MIDLPALILDLDTDYYLEYRSSNLTNPGNIITNRTTAPPGYSPAFRDGVQDDSFAVAVIFILFQVPFGAMFPVDPLTLLPTSATTKLLEEGPDIFVDLLLEASTTIDALILHTSSSNTGVATVGNVNVTGLIGGSEMAQLPITLIAPGITTLNFIVEDFAVAANFTFSVELKVLENTDPFISAIEDLSLFVNENAEIPKL
eukprot:TRINITY_DN2870_c0_g2_i2.p1 TRINITY_DN2870_c0_g2~~TRINITY_DN2870_c0_g2_i2.p1  ORF type:complete len:201 (+),score=45.11 TRINITY_DN2870_c0_g2_i2:35-637(+)